MRGGVKAKRKLHRLLFHFQNYFEILPSTHVRSSEATILHLEDGMKATLMRKQLCS